MMKHLLILALSVTALSISAQEPAPVLENRPDAATPSGGDELGPAFHSPASGISFRAPGNMKEIRRSPGDEVIVAYVDEARQWQFKVSRVMFPKDKPAPLTTDTQANRETGVIRMGLIESNVEQLKADAGGADILRQDLINIADLQVGMIAARYKTGPDIARLTQRAIVQAGNSEELYYVFDLGVPAPREGDVTTDAGVKQAVILFSKMLDTVKLLDQREILADQNERLFRTRAALVNLNESRLRESLHKEQWMLLSRNGKPIGYTYVVERTGADIPRSGQDINTLKSASDGVLIGVRTRTIPEPDKQIDAESWLWMSFDRKHEVWSNVAYVNEPDPLDPSKRRQHKKGGEFGSSDATIERVKDERLEVGEKRPDGSMDQFQPPLRQQEIYTLSVTPVNLSGDDQPLTRELPPFYAPQALAHLLPRLLAKHEGKTYLFASYVPDRKEVLKRYLDVGLEQPLVLGGKAIRAVPVNDRIGLEGSVTTHYISPKGEYLGSENKESGITVTPTDAATLEKLFPKPNLTAPAEVAK